MSFDARFNAAHFYGSKLAYWLHRLLVALSLRSSFECSEAFFLLYEASSALLGTLHRRDLEGGSSLKSVSSEVGIDSSPGSVKVRGIMYE